MGWSHVSTGGAQNTSSAVSSLSVTTGSVGVGNYIIAWCVCDLSNISATLSISDPSNGTYAVLKSYPAPGTQAFSLVICGIKATTGGVLTLTSAPSASTFFPVMGYDEFSFSGTASLNSSNAATGTGATSGASGSYSSLAGDLLYTLFGIGTAAGTVTVPAGFTAGTSFGFSSGHATGAAPAYLLSASGGTVNPSYSWTTSATWIVAGVSITQSGAGPTFTPWIYGDQCGEMWG